MPRVFPNDVKQDVLEIQVAVVTVRAPAAGAKVNFHVAGTRRTVADLNDCAPKIRPAFDADETGVENADRDSAGGFQLVALEPLMLPGGLKQAFGRQVVFIAQNIGRDVTAAPGRIEIFRRRKHFPDFLRPKRDKVKPMNLTRSASNGRWAC